MFLVENVLNLVVRLGNLWVIRDVFEDTMGYGNDLIQDGPFGRVGPRPAPSVPSRSVYFQQLMICAFSSKLPIFQRSPERLEPISYSESINCGDMAHFVSIMRSSGACGVVMRALSSWPLRPFPTPHDQVLESDRVKKCEQ